MTKALLIIDPQRDFTMPTGALYVPGADKDMLRLTSLITTHGATISEIFVTMDSHYVMHIAHPAFWVNDSGAHPDPFTTITYDDVRHGLWHAPLNNDLSMDYLQQLEGKGKTHTIWPPHCIVGTEGYELFPDLQQALTKYAAHYGNVHIIHKGGCLFAEHFSALRAEVENSMFPETMINEPLLHALDGFDNVLFAGECADICVRETLRDICSYAPRVAAKLTILADGMSPLSTSFSFDTDEVYRHAVAIGSKIGTCEQQA